ncbi:unnamed protein product [Gongylonema pulchrum]|uniref:Helicase ATP-binding domain-containing protein n=1 Tax=Gongylonema pulchrum TaxID=637853 RepID=A0A183E967_9BILA|nr:unnamed protein product [Gongylonema pulchrum]
MGFWISGFLDFLEWECAKSSCGKSCPFTRSDAIEDLCDGLLANKLSGIADLADNGKKISGCPYFGTRKAVPYSQLIMCPYQVLLQEDARKAWGLDLRDNVVVIDEAHNLLEIITNSHSATLSVNALQNIRRVLKLFDLLEYIEQSHLIAKLTKFSKRLEKENQNPKDEPVRYVSGVERLMGVRDVVASEDPKTNKSPARTEREESTAAFAFHSLKRFLDLLTLRYVDSRIIIECSSEKINARYHYLFSLIFK